MNPEKAPDVPFSFIVAHGVRLESRYGKRREFEVMGSVVGVLSPDDRVLIDKIWCDSKAESCYSVNLHYKGAGPHVARILNDAFRKIAGGHNGIWLKYGEMDCGDVEPEWDFDDVY